MSDLKINMTPVQGVTPASGSRATDNAKGVDFTSLVKQSIDEVNSNQSQARALAEQFEQGDPNVDLVRVMIEMQRARVSFEAVSQVRNKLVEAYREVMNMQV